MKRFPALSATVCILIIAGMISCREHGVQTVYVEDFLETADLAEEECEIGGDLLNPEEMFVLGDRLVVLQRRAERLFHVYHLPDLSFMYATGMRGHSANEFIEIENATIQPQNDSTFTLLDNYMLKTVVIHSDGETKVISADMAFKILPVNGFVNCGDGMCVSFADCATGETGNKELRYAIRGGEEQKFSPYPILDGENLDGDMRCQRYYKNLAYDSKSRTLMSFYCFFGYIRLYRQYNGFELTREIHVDDGKEKSLQSRYGTTCPGRNGVYVSSRSRDIQLWSWEGQPLALYHIDSPFRFFTVDEKHNRIYIIRQSRENILTAYDLPSTHRQ